jgi:predicted nucleic acid-binding protein
MTKIYLDNCCLNRPFDDQTQPRIHLEAEAIKTILKLYEQGYWEIVISQVSLVEVHNVKDPSKRQKRQYIISQIRSLIQLSEPLIQRAKYFESSRLEAMDAMHLACAEHGAEVFLTVDDKFLKKAKLIPDLNIKLANPLTWLQTICYEPS